MEKITANELFEYCIDENTPIDWGWIRHIRRTYTWEEKRSLARINIELIAPPGCSKQLIECAAKYLLDYLDL